MASAVSGGTYGGMKDAVATVVRNYPCTQEALIEAVCVVDGWVEWAGVKSAIAHKADGSETSSLRDAASVTLSTEHGEITEQVRWSGHTLKLETVSSVLGGKGRGSLHVSKREDGGCQVTWTSAMETNLPRFIVRRKIRRGLEESLGRLSARVR